MHIQNFVKFYHFVPKIWSWNKILNEILKSNKGHNSITNAWKIMCNNAKIDCIKINAYTKFGEILSICFEDIERKRKPDGQTDGMTDGMTDNPNPV